VIAVALYKNRARLDEKVFKTRYGSLYVNMNTSRFMCYQYVTIYLLRRLIFALSIEYLGSSPGLQIIT
jgi:hypothetical protein